MPGNPQSDHAAIEATGETLMTDTEPAPQCVNVLDAGDRRFTCTREQGHDGYHETEDGKLRW